MSSLPAELERDIFETCVRNDVTTAPALMLVAKRVRIWVEPMLYESITIGRLTVDDALLMRTFTSKPVAFFASAVKNLCMTRRVPNDAARYVLEACSSVQRLACWVDRLENHGLGELIIPLAALRELSCGMSLFRVVAARSLECSWVFRLTHLELIMFDIEFVQLSIFPQLTHFSLLVGYFEAVVGDLITFISATCSFISVISVQFEEADHPELAFPWSTDPRVVLSLRDRSEPTRAWTKGDRWTTVERVIEERKALGSGALPSTWLFDLSVILQSIYVKVGKLTTYSSNTS
ncbi:hypothetical protein BDZ89DRAFT_1140407 [Hymenopellis radicata]|nr:hypothetical protein BDZ89DRAFT_1140407 [Hymenopellis radicata]